MLGSLLAPPRVPERVMEALTEAGRELGLIRSEVTRVREQTEPLAELLPALESLKSGLDARLDSLHDVVAALESEESFLNETVHEMTRELRAVHETLAGLQTTSSASPSISPGDVGRYRRFVTCSPVTTTTELGLPEPGGPSRPVSNGSAG